MAQRTRDVAILGQGASDLEIFDFARAAGAVIVTANHCDFEALAVAKGSHPGLIFVPTMIGSALAALFKAGLSTAEEVIAKAGGQIVGRQANGKIISYSV
jgi:predicted nuclease of predicted toxin-antitoxin system